MKHKFNEELENKIIDQIVQGEYYLSARNKRTETLDYESYIDLFDLTDGGESKGWNSKLKIPEFAAHVLTQASIDASQAFQTRDFVETYLEDESDEAIASAEAQKELINRTLNQRHINHYQKYMRGKNISNIAGRVYFHAWWEQETRESIIGTETKTEELDVDEQGRAITDPEIQVPARRSVQEDIIGDVVVTDRFNYDVLDERNVFTDNEYVYTLQQKDWVIVRTEVTLKELQDQEESRKYFNLHLLKDLEPSRETDTSLESYNKINRYDKKSDVYGDPGNPYDKLTRYGKYWCVVRKRDETGYPVVVTPGLDPATGDPLKNAEFLEAILTFIVCRNHEIMIGFQTTPYLDANNKPYKPIFRGLCYIHPTDDKGIGDGQFARELQIGINDTFNVSNDRVMLATNPTLKVKKYSNQDNPTLYIEPNHIMEVEESDDITELLIKDDIQGAMNQIGMLTAKMQQTTSIYPTTMGELPSKASTTATAVAGAETRSNNRANYKGLTYENTAMSELYWMITQMTFRFAKPETGLKLMGEKVYNWNPWRDDYYYKPVSQSIETEQSKQMKINKWIQVLGFIGQIQHPDMVKQVNYVLSQIYKYMGDEFVNFKNKMLNENVRITGGGGGSPEGQQNMEPASNQNQIPQSAVEIGARETAGTGGFG